MRLSLVSSLALVPALALSLPAQGSDRVIRPGGASSAALHARVCTKSTIEMIDVAPVSADSTLPLSKSYREHAAKEVFFYFNPPEARTPRYATVRLTAHRSGAVSSIDVVETSNDYFSREVERAVGEAARGRAFVPFPDDVTRDSLMLQLSVGRRAGDAKPYLAKRTVCPVWPLASNPVPEYPTDLRVHGVQGYVQARFMVDASGRIDPGTFQVLQSNADGFTRAVIDVLPRLRYQPAEVQGRKVEQLTEQTFTFGIADHPMP
jgi:hypothetical protein